MKIHLPTVYPITDTRISVIPIAEQLRQMAAGGARLIQVREKAGSTRDLYAIAFEAVRLAKEYGVRLIINDRVDIAKLVGADGVHLGQEDLSPVHARSLLGEEAIIGYSTHTRAQVAEAVNLPIDYLAFGPIFKTSTKADPDPVVGLERLSDIKKLTGDLPVVAIGGINAANLNEVLAAGADSAAVIGAILSGPEPISENVRSLFAQTTHTDKDVVQG